MRTKITHLRRDAPGSYRYAVVDAPGHGRNEQIFYGDYRFGRERMEEARSARYSTHMGTVARGAGLLTALFR